MPFLDAQIGPDGPVISVAIGFSGPRSAFLQASGGTIPTPVMVRALVDTGASGTAIDSSVVTALGLAPTGSIPVHTPSTQGVPHYCNQYDISLWFLQSPPQSTAHNMALTMPVIETDFTGQNFRALLGRDILARCTMFYHGPGGLVTISY